ncbi:MAG: energy transducer TonB [Pyrinomonadaceae bacterium]
MKRFCLIISFIFITSVLAFAQTENAESWKVITPSAEEFSAEFPVSPEATDFDESDKSENNSRRYKAESGGTYFFIFSDAADKPVQSKTVMDFAARFQAGASLPAGDFQSRKFAFKGADGYHHTILAVKTPTRIYIFQTTSHQDDNPQVERFFAGVKFDKQITDADGARPTKNKKGGKSNIMPRVMNPVGLGSGIGRGTGNGTGNGNGENRVASPNSQPPQTQTVPLKLLSNPRANYTDLARFYQITGSVRLRVTFSANGKIGAVSPMSSLPFGLLDEAMNAARNIEFTPAMKDGKPYEIAKVVEYSFTIY